MTPAELQTAVAEHLPEHTEVFCTAGTEPGHYVVRVLCERDCTVVNALSATRAVRQVLPLTCSADVKTYLNMVAM